MPTKDSKRVVVISSGGAVKAFHIRTRRFRRLVFDSKRDTQHPFTAVGKAFNVKFVFADERIQNVHMLEKIRGYIVDSVFGIYDISGWNPNVALELGLALGLASPACIAFRPEEDCPR